MSLYDDLKAAADRDKLRLHTPGHKGALNKLDLTELSDGSFPADCVEKAERRAAEIYGVGHARFLCGGSSQGVKAAIHFAHVPILADVNSHRSVFDGAALSGVSYVTAGERGSVRPLTAKQIDAALTPDTKAILVTTPTYYGFCADVAGIAEYCKKRGLVFIADGAHGAHFGFSDKLPENAAHYCDICNLSAHKTLSSLTQSALLLNNLSESDNAELSRSVDIMGTTSPSYLLYASIDDAVRKAADKSCAEAYLRLFDATESLKKVFPFLRNDDFTRLVLDCAALGLSSVKLNTALAKRGVYSELADDKYIVFILTAENTPNDVTALEVALAASIREIR